MAGYVRAPPEWLYLSDWLHITLWSNVSCKLKKSVFNFLWKYTSHDFPEWFHSTKLWDELQWIENGNVWILPVSSHWDLCLPYTKSWESIQCLSKQKKRIKFDYINTYFEIRHQIWTVIIYVKKLKSKKDKDYTADLKNQNSGRVDVLLF